MMTPTIHLNGTSRSDLLQGYIDAATAVRAALETVCKSHPNGRDYYPQGTGAITTAMNEHYARVGKLQAVADELTLLAETINA